MKYTTIKNEAQEKYSALNDECGLFWAFSNEQFAEGKKKNPVKEGERYTSIGSGGYLPSKNVDKWLKGMKAIEAWQKAEIKKAKTEEVILYELNNHEAFYTGTIEDAMPVLADLGYTEEQVKAVYHKNREFAIN